MRIGTKTIKVDAYIDWEEKRWLLVPHKRTHTEYMKEYNRSITQVRIDLLNIKIFLILARLPKKGGVA